MPDPPSFRRRVRSCTVVFRIGPWPHPTRSDSPTPTCAMSGIRSRRCRTGPSRRPADHRARRRLRAHRHRRQPLHRRCVVALGLRPRTSSTRDRRGHPRPTRSHRALPRCSASHRRRRSSSPHGWRVLAPPGLEKVFYSEAGACGRRDRAQDGVRLLVPPRGDEEANVHLRCDEAYHGDTLGAVSVGGMDLFHEAYRPLLFDTVHRAPSPYLDEKRSTDWKRS